MEPTPNLIEDRRLLAAVAVGRTDAQRELLQRLWARVHRTARYLSRDVTEAEDLAQEALLEVLGAAKGYRGQGCLEAWADVIAVRTIRRRTRRSRLSRWLLGTALGEAREPVAPRSASPERQLLQKNRAGRLGALLSRLNERQHTALVLKVVQGYTVDEVAALMEERPETVRYLIRKGRSKLRRFIEKDPALGELLTEEGR